MAWVSILALIGVVLFALVAVGWRVWLQWRKTGDTGLRGLSRSPVELLAGLALVLGLGGVVAAPIVDLVGVLRVALVSVVPRVGSRVSSSSLQGSR